MKRKQLFDLWYITFQYGGDSFGAISYGHYAFPHNEFDYNYCLRTQMKNDKRESMPVITFAVKTRDGISIEETEKTQENIKLLQQE